MSEVISGTQAAKKLGLGKNKTFVIKFVRTGLIKPVRFPGSKRDVYVETEVEELIEKCRRHNSFNATQVAKKILRSYKTNYLRS